MANVFISYSHKNSDVAGQIAAILSECNISYFEYERDIVWGKPITTEVRENLKEAKAIIPILSPASLKSQWVMFEIGFAVGAEKDVLPFLTDPDLDIPDFIRDLRCASSLEKVRSFFSEIDFTDVSSTSLESIDFLFTQQKIDFQELSETMPDLLREMKNDINVNKNRLIRNCVVLRGNYSYSYRDPHFVYRGTEIEDLTLKFEHLESLGLVENISHTDLPIYKMSEEFVRFLRTSSFKTE